LLIFGLAQCTVWFALFKTTWLETRLPVVGNHALLCSVCLATVSVLLYVALNALLPRANAHCMSQMPSHNIDTGEATPRDPDCNITLTCLLSVFDENVFSSADIVGETVPRPVLETDIRDPARLQAEQIRFLSAPAHLHGLPIEQRSSHWQGAEALDALLLALTALSSPTTPFIILTSKLPDSSPNQSPPPSEGQAEESAGYTNLTEACVPWAIGMRIHPSTPVQSDAPEAVHGDAGPRLLPLRQAPVIQARNSLLNAVHQYRQQFLLQAPLPHLLAWLHSQKGLGQ
jgi:hypothetical protein